MFGIRSAIHSAYNFFRSAFAPIVNQLKTKEGRDKATHTLTAVVEMGVHAVPIVKAALRLTGVSSEYTDAVLAGAQKYGLKVEDVLAEPDEFARIGKLIRIEGAGLREYIARILPTVENGIEIAGDVIHTVEQLNLVPAKVFEGAIHLAHISLDVAHEISK